MLLSSLTGWLQSPLPRCCKNKQINTCPHKNYLIVYFGWVKLSCDQCFFSTRNTFVKAVRSVVITGSSNMVVFYIFSFILPTALTRSICRWFFYITFIVLPVKEIMICIPLLCGFAWYVYTQSREVLWQDVKAMVASAGPLLCDIAKYITQQFPSECKAVAMQVWSVLYTASSCIICYLRNHALGDAWSLLKLVHRATVGICVWLYRFLFGRVADNPQ